MSGRYFTRIGLIPAIYALALLGSMALISNTWAVKPDKLMMHVESVDIALTTQGEPLWTATAEILIYDQNSNPVAEAAVTGDWYLDGSILSSGASAVTDGNGIALIVFGPQNANAGQNFTFTVTNVKLRGLTL